MNLKKQMRALVAGAILATVPSLALAAAAYPTIVPSRTALAAYTSAQAVLLGNADVITSSYQDLYTYSSSSTATPDGISVIWPSDSPSTGRWLSGGPFLAAAKNLTVSNTMTLTATDGATLNIGAGGTLGSNAYTGTAYLPLAGGTLTGNLLFTDNSYDIGATGATRPRNLYLSGQIISGGIPGFGDAVVPAGLGNFASTSYVQLRLARGVASGNITNGGGIQFLEFGVYDSSTFAYYAGPYITAIATQTWTAGTNQGSNLKFYTIPNNSTTRTLALTLGQDQSATVAAGLTATALTDSGLTATRVPYAGTGGLLSDDSGFTYNSGTHALTTTTFVGALSGNATTATSATTATNATNAAITDDTTTNATMYPVWVTANTGNLPAKVASTKLSFNPSTAALTTTTFIGALTGHGSLDLPLTGGTLTGNLLFTDATYDIGAVGATRPRTIYLSGQVVSAGVPLFGAAVTAGGGTFADLGLYSNSSYGALKLLRGATSGNITNGGGIQAIEFSVYDTSTFTAYAGPDITAIATQTWTAGTNQGSNLKFYTIPNNSTTRTLALTIGSDQSLLAAGSLTGLTGLTSSGTITLTGVTTGTNVDTACFATGGVMTLQAAACTISSKRFKNLMPDFTGSALALLAKLPVGQFTMKGTETNADPNARSVQLGLYAEDVAKVEPRCAVYDPDMKTPKSWRQECVIALLVKATQEQQGEIAALRAANDNLRAQFAHLRHRH